MQSYLKKVAKNHFYRCEQWFMTVNNSAIPVLNPSTFVLFVVRPQTSLLFWKRRIWSGEACSWARTSTPSPWLRSRPSPLTFQTNGSYGSALGTAASETLTLLLFVVVFRVETEAWLLLCSRSKPDIKMEPSSGRPVDYQVRRASCVCVSVLIHWWYCIFPSRIPSRWAWQWLKPGSWWGRTWTRWSA